MDKVLKSLVFDTETFPDREKVNVSAMQQIAPFHGSTKYFKGHKISHHGNLTK